MAISVQPTTSCSQAPEVPTPERERIVSILRDFKRDRGDAFGILALGVFGSVARGNATADSDVDVYVQTRTANPYLLVHIKEYLERLVHRKVDIVRLRDRMSRELKARIEREGVDV